MNAFIEGELFEVSSLKAQSESTIKSVLGYSLFGAQGLMSPNASVTSRCSINKLKHLQPSTDITCRVITFDRMAHVSFSLMDEEKNAFDCAQRLGGCYI